MKKIKNEKRSVVFSALSVILSFALLAGGTLAWFSDTETGSNLINTGNLDVELNHIGSNGVEKVEANTDLFLNVDGNEIVWEPGAVATETFVVENAGTLDLAYDFNLNTQESGVDTADGKSYLGDYLKVAFVPATVAEDGTVTPASITREGIADLDFVSLSEVESRTGTLQENQSEAYTVVVYWQPVSNDVDNIFNLNNGRSGSYQLELGIELNATQQTGEKDSIDDGYDAKAVDEFITGGVGTDEGENADPFA